MKNLSQLLVFSLPRRFCQRLVIWFGPFRAAWLALLALLLMVLACGFFLLPPSTTAHLEATTEFVELTTVSDAKDPRWRSRPLEWDLGRAKVRACHVETGEIGDSDLLEGETLELLPGAHVSLLRREGSALLRVQIEPSNLVAAGQKGPNVSPANRCGPQLPVRKLTHDGRALWFHGDRVVLLRRFETQVGQPWSDAALVLPVDARITVGQEVGDGTSAMLVSGNASIHATHDKPDWLVHLLHFSSRRDTYIAEHMLLQRGDRLSVPEYGVAKGFIRVPPVGPLQIAGFGASERVLVMRAGNARVEMDQSIWSRIENEPAIGGVLAMLGLLVAVLEVWVSLQEHKPHELLGRVAHPEVEDVHRE